MNGVSQDIFSSTGIYSWTFPSNFYQNAGSHVPNFNNAVRAHVPSSDEARSLPGVGQLHTFSRVLISSILAELKQVRISSSILQ
jgi:hypothetical protein